MSARDEVLARVREALQDVPDGERAEDVTVAWSYGRPLATGAPGSAEVVDDFVEKVEDYGAVVVRVPSGGVETALREALAALDARKVVLPDGLDPAWVSAVAGAGVETFTDDPVLSHQELNGIDTVVTTAAVGMADSGTIALDHSAGQGRRALTLLPDKHLCVVRTSQVVSDVPEGIAVLAPAIRSRQPVTWLSGGSATSDIELSRVEGVHGPRTLCVLLLQD